MPVSFLTRYELSNAIQTLLLAILMVVLLGVIGWLVAGRSGLLWSLFAGGLLALFSPVMSPRLVLAMFDARPIPPGRLPELERVNAELSRRAGLERPPRLYYLPSVLMNSFATGRPADSAVALSDGLLRRLGEREIVAILAHEISHIRHRDLWVMALADIVGRLTAMLALVGYLLALVYVPLWLAGEAAIPWLLLLVFILAPNVSALLQLALSRLREYRADLGAVELTGDAEGMARALERIEHYETHWLYRLLLPHRRNPLPSILRTHPPTSERVARLRRLAGGPGGAGGGLHRRPIEPHVDEPPGPRERFHGPWF